MAVQQDSGGSIRLTDSDLFEVADDADDVALPDEVTGKQSLTELPLPAPRERQPDEITNVSVRARQKLRDGTSAKNDQRDGTSARSDQRDGTRAKNNQRAWVDLHAVVDEEGRLRLPEDAARKLQPGAIVEVRVAAWALDPAENA